MEPRNKKLRMTYQNHIRSLIYKLSQSSKNKLKKTQLDRQREPILTYTLIHPQPAIIVFYPSSECMNQMTNLQLILQDCLER